VAVAGSAGRSDPTTPGQSGGHIIAGSDTVVKSASRRAGAAMFEVDENDGGDMLIKIDWSPQLVELLRQTSDCLGKAMLIMVPSDEIQLIFAGIWPTNIRVKASKCGPADNRWERSPMRVTLTLPEVAISKILEVSGDRV
jgi:ribonuclease I